MFEQNGGGGGWVYGFHKMYPKMYPRYISPSPPSPPQPIEPFLNVTNQMKISTNVLHFV